ncbi:hypothetical protein [Microbacterium sp. T32]|uniref:hypothetical protein n=1 Tax=Microbacterium sp. T32 TaxID=1776083 RepID=UPI0007ABA713|nr:hypothetical protein [Microbacterium sp. T32]KZE42090.1 hypothetical protein AVW09_11245 [Microbacterium sp. T32]
MVNNARELPTEIVAREIDATLRTAIGRALNEWGRSQRLPPLSWSVDHWEGYVTVIGTPDRRSLRKKSAANRWATSMNLEPVSGRTSRWHLTTGEWHVEIRGWDN